MRIHVRGYAERADGDGPIPFVVATAGVKADGLDLQMDRLDLTRYQANPVVLYGHDYWSRPPIGRAESVRVDGDTLRADLVFDLDDEFARTVERKIRSGFLNAVSVGFDAHGVDRSGVPERWELYEISVVPLPMDPDAVAEGGRALAYSRELAADIVAVRERMDAVQRALAAMTPTTGSEPGSAPAAVLADRRRRLRLLEASL